MYCTLLVTQELVIKSGGNPRVFSAKTLPEKIEPAHVNCWITKTAEHDGNEWDSCHLEAMVFEASYHFKLLNPLNQVKHVEWTFFSKEKNQLQTQNHNLGFSKIFGTNGSASCVAWIMVDVQCRSSLPCCLCSAPLIPFDHLLSPHTFKTNASAASFHAIYETKAKSKDCSCVFFFFTKGSLLSQKQLVALAIHLHCLITIRAAERFISSWDICLMVQFAA